MHNIRFLLRKDVPCNYIANTNICGQNFNTINGHNNAMSDYFVIFVDPVARQHVMWHINKILTSRQVNKTEYYYRN